MGEKDNKISEEFAKERPADSTVEAALEDDLELTKSDGDDVAGGIMFNP